MKQLILFLLSSLCLISCGTSSTEFSNSNTKDNANQSLLHVKYAGSISGIEEFEEEDWEEVKSVSPFVEEIPESQIIQGEINPNEQIMVLLVTPQEKANLKIEGIHTKQVYYEGSQPILLVSTMDPLQPTIRITVSNEKDSIIYEPGFRYDIPRLRIESERIIDETDYQSLEDTLFLPIYQTSCMSIVYYIPEIHEQLENGEKLAPPLFEQKINDQYFLVFGYGDDPLNGKIEMYYAVRPFNFTMYKSKDLKEWELMNEDHS
ncbi:MAG: hypothetical protein IKE51_01655 [Solobacterium sp.]|nr:hypothetical protein [Solobacterium sp.]